MWAILRIPDSREGDTQLEAQIVGCLTRTFDLDVLSDKHWHEERLRDGRRAGWRDNLRRVVVLVLDSRGEAGRNAKTECLTVSQLEGQMLAQRGQGNRIYCIVDA